MHEGGEMEQIPFTFKGEKDGIEVESIYCQWDLDRQFINEYGWLARIVLLSLTFVGTTIGIVVGSVVLRNTVRQG